MPAVDPARADIDVRQYSSIAALCLIASSFSGNGSETHVQYSSITTIYTRQLHIQQYTEYSRIKKRDTRF